MERDEEKYYYVGSNLGEHPIARAIAAGLLPPESHPIMRLRKLRKLREEKIGDSLP